MTVAGLPLHPLVVHLVVVLVPLSALGFVLCTWRIAWRRTCGWLVAVGAAAGGVAAFIAAQTGEVLEKALRQASGTRIATGSHPDHGNIAEILALAFGLVAVSSWAIERRGGRWRTSTWARRALHVVGAFLAVAATVATVLAGDSGARLVWEKLGTFVVPH